MPYTLPALPYPYNALEPSIDAKTMEIHHTKHHQTYVDKLNAALEKHPTLQNLPLESVMKQLPALTIDETDKTAIKNHGGGHLNHTLFWSIMDPKRQKDHELTKDIESTFTSVENFKKIFSEKALAHFGSGWAWLVRDENNILRVYSLPNQDSPYLKGHTPLLGLDVWEHAYYLKYQNRRGEYIDNWWNIVRFL